MKVSANLAIREYVLFWVKASIPMKAQPNSIKVLVYPNQVWKELQKNCRNPQDVYEHHEDVF